MRAITLIWIVFLTACTPRAVREAESVVAQADSLRTEGRMYGIDEGDSTTLAQAYETLKKYSEVSRQFSEICPFIPCTSSLCTYAHACYHYGRLLREKDNPVEAMECFINATHSRTRDYHILGRVYSNMGSICHLAGEYPLSYEMYEKSAQVFLQGEDTLSYYYLLNDMAFELAEQGKKEETLFILSSIEKNCFDDGVLLKILETKAEAYLRAHDYDSAKYFAYKCKDSHNTSLLWALQLAQSYSWLSVKDSAAYYAQQIISNQNNANDLFVINNALYILTNDDQTKNIASVRETAAARSDVQKLIEIRQGKLSQAVQLLDQDLSRRPNLGWLYAIIGTLMVITTIIIIYVRQKHKRQKLLTQQIGVLEKTAITMQAKNDKLSEQLKEREENQLKHIQANCEWFIKSHEIRNFLQKEDYNKVCELINSRFSMLTDKLKMTGRLNEKDICLCAFVLDGSLTDKQVADILYYSHNTIRSNKRYVAKKLGTTSANLRSFLLKKVME